MTSRPNALLAAILAAALAGCASQPMPPPGQSGMGDPIAQPFKDLSLIREVAPEVLVQAAAAPYRPAADCAALRAELAELDKALGPDVDRVQAGDGLGGLVRDLISGAVGLPFRGVVRKVSGAEARDRALKAAVLSGMVRRGYLKGASAQLRCGTAVAKLP
jgi:hypothetical protein